MNKSGWLKKQFIGVDFSGSARAGNLIWITSGVYESGGLKIIDCLRARDLPDGGIKRDIALAVWGGYAVGKKQAESVWDYPRPRRVEFYEGLIEVHHG